MKYNPLGRTQVDVSEICLGTMTWGSQNTEAEAHEQMDYAVSEGVNFFDTAEMYPTTPLLEETMGRTEEYIGTWFAARKKRDDVLIATKVLGNGRWASPKGDDITAAKIKANCEGSLKRLQTDYIDLYQLHWPNRGSYHFRQSWSYAPEKQDTEKAKADTHEILRAIGDLVDEGKIRHFGLSNDTAWGTMQFLNLAEKEALPRVVSIQNEYSLLHRIYDTDMAELSHHEDVGLLSFSPLAAGLLTGKYADGKIPEGSRRSMNANLGGRASGHEEPALNGYLDVAKKHGLDPNQMALAFCMTRPFMASTIIGATSMEQLRVCIGAKDVSLSDDVMSDIAHVRRVHRQPL